MDSRESLAVFVIPDGPGKISLACNLEWKAFLCLQNFILKKFFKKFL